MNIMVVENQYKQFQTIKGHLIKTGYTVYPQEEQYAHFIDSVRVWVNKEYGEAYRTLALKNIIEVFQECYERGNAEVLILMDYKLGAGCTSLTGIELAEKIQEARVKNEAKNVPVVFLSRTPQNDLKMKEKYEKDFLLKYPLSRWAAKGYFGDELLSFEYFKEHVLKDIQELKIEETLPAQLEKMSTMMFPNDIKGCLKKIKEELRTLLIKGLGEEILAILKREKGGIFKAEDRERLLEIVKELNKK